MHRCDDTKGAWPGMQASRRMQPFCTLILWHLRSRRAVAHASLGVFDARRRWLLLADIAATQQQHVRRHGCFAQSGDCHGAVLMQADSVKFMLNVGQRTALLPAGAVATPCPRIVPLLVSFIIEAPSVLKSAAVGGTNLLAAAHPAAGPRD